MVAQKNKLIYIFIYTQIRTIYWPKILTNKYIYKMKKKRRKDIAKAKASLTASHG